MTEPIQRILRLISDENLRDPNINPNRAHRNISKTLLREDELLHAHLYPNRAEMRLPESDEIKLLLRDEVDRMINAVTAGTVAQVLIVIRENRETEEQERIVRSQLKQMPISELRMWAYPFIRSRVPFDAADHGFPELLVLVGYTRVRFVLSLIINRLEIEYESIHNGGCRCTCRYVDVRDDMTESIRDEETDVISGIDYSDIAALELIDILHFSIPVGRPNEYRTLERLTLDIEPKRINMNRHPSEWFFRKVNRYMWEQQPRRLMSTRRLSVRIFRHLVPRDQPLYYYLYKRVLTEVTIRTWDDSDLTVYRGRPSILRYWPEWANLQTLDINDEFLQRYRPNLHFLRNVQMFEFSADDVVLYLTRFINNRVPEGRNVTITTRFRDDVHLCNLTIHVNSELMHCMFYDDVRRIREIFLLLTPPFQIWHLN